MKYQINITANNGLYNEAFAKTKVEALRIAKSAVKAGALNVCVIDSTKPFNTVGYIVFDHEITAEQIQTPDSKFMIAVGSLAPSGVGRNNDYLFASNYDRALEIAQKSITGGTQDIEIYAIGGGHAPLWEYSLVLKSTPVKTEIEIFKVVEGAMLDTQAYIRTHGNIVHN